MLTDLIKCNYRLPKTNKSYMGIFSRHDFLKYFQKDFYTCKFKSTQGRYGGEGSSTLF